MRFAVISDIQGNLAALEAVLRVLDTPEARIERVVAAGDLVGLGDKPNEVLDLVRKLDIAAVLGNYDDAVAFDRTQSGLDFPDEAAEAADTQALLWTRQRLTPENLEFLRGLPRDIRLLPGATRLKVEANTGDDRTNEYRRGFLMRAMFGGLARTPAQATKRVRVVHGSPRALNELVRAETANSILSVLAREAQADVLVSGHARVSFRRDHENLTFIGVGPVSDPDAANGRAQYAIVDVGRTVEVDFGEAGYE